MITEKEIRHQYNIGDPYFLLTKQIRRSIPQILIPYIDTIRKQSQWAKTELKIITDINGNYISTIEKNLHFDFFPLLIADENKLLAIESQKKYTQHPHSIFLLILQGCSYSDFIASTQDVISYCEAMKLFENNQYTSALPHIKKAFEIKPNVQLYASLYFDIRLRLNDETSIYDEIKYFENDIDSLIHTERAYKFVRFLYRNKKHTKAIETIKIINQLIDDLISGKREKKLFGKQKKHYYKYNKEQFNKKIETTKNRIIKNQATITKLYTTNSNINE